MSLESILRSVRSMFDNRELPDEFRGGARCNNVHFSCDGSKYAIMSKGNLIISDVPENGVIEADGTRIEINRSGKGVSIRSFSSGPNIVSGVISISIGNAPKADPIDKTYTGVEQVSVELRDGNLKISGVEDSSVRVQGAVLQDPELKGGKLQISGLDDDLNVGLLKGVDNDVSLKTADGNITGGMRGGGDFQTRDGNINLSLLLSSGSKLISQDGTISLLAEGGAPLEVRTRNGEVDLKGAAQCKLSVISTDGDVNCGLELCESVEIETRDGEITVKNKAQAPVRLRSTDGNISLDARQSESIEVTSRDGEVTLRTDSNAPLRIKTQDGDINATIVKSEGGSIASRDGDVSIELSCPLAVEVGTRDGDIRVRNMISEGCNRYLPPDAAALGTLRITTQDGDISIRYK